MKNFIFIILLILSICYTPANADTIFLKNGSKIENVAAWEDGNQVKCYRFGSIIGYQKEYVDRVEKGEVIEEESHSEEKTVPSAGMDSSFLGSGEVFKVEKVYDGDTFKASGSNIMIMVRILGIDAPETEKKDRRGQHYSQKSKKYLEMMIAGKSFQLKGYGMDKYNRLLAQVFIGNVDVGLEMVKTGLAEVYRGSLPINLDDKLYRNAEEQAKKYRKGIWSLGDKYISPKEWRRKYK